MARASCVLLLLVAVCASLADAAAFNCTGKAKGEVDFCNPPGKCAPGGLKCICPLRWEAHPTCAMSYYDYSFFPPSLYFAISVCGVTNIVLSVITILGLIYNFRQAKLRGGSFKNYCTTANGTLIFLLLSLFCRLIFKPLLGWYYAVPLSSLNYTNVGGSFALAGVCFNQIALACMDCFWVNLASKDRLYGIIPHRMAKWVKASIIIFNVLQIVLTLLFHTLWKVIPSTSAWSSPAYSSMIIIWNLQPVIAFLLVARRIRRKLSGDVSKTAVTLKSVTQYLGLCQIFMVFHSGVYLFLMLARASLNYAQIWTVIQYVSTFVDLPGEIFLLLAVHPGNARGWKRVVWGAVRRDAPTEARSSDCYYGTHIKGSTTATNSRPSSSGRPSLDSNASSQRFASSDRFSESGPPLSLASLRLSERMSTRAAATPSPRTSETAPSSSAVSARASESLLPDTPSGASGNQAPATSTNV